MMTQTEQRIAIAEWMEIFILKRGEFESDLTPKDWTCQCGTNLSITNNTYDYCVGELLKYIPNYPLDLNAMHEAEKKLNDVQQINYIASIWKHSPNFTENTYLLNQVKLNQTIWWSIATATSQQRSEALCRTLWPERFEQ